jgi:hypothetical protein
MAIIVFHIKELLDKVNFFRGMSLAILSFGLHPQAIASLD